MTITCKNCNFSIQTCVEGFSLGEQNANYCTNCGKKYSEVGVDTPTLYKADQARMAIITKIFLLYILFPLVGVSLWFFGLLIIDRAWVVKNFSFKFFASAACLGLVYIIGTIIYAHVRGNKKFKKIAGG